LGSFWTLRAAIKYMRNQNYGRVVNTSSGTAAFGIKNMFSYIVGKSAILGMTRSAALDNDDKNIRVNAICPVALTTMDPQYWEAFPSVDKVSAHPRWVAPVSVYLASESCALSGEILSAGFGRWARVFTAKTRGVGVGETVDDVAAVIDQICDISSFDILRSAQEQYS
jgi:NAD(P)-dependent dehydrogenase (short-subunit alcohol dehydrogenase family)